MLGLKHEFLDDPPVTHNAYIPQFSKEDESAIDLEMQKLLAKGVITKCEHETGEYISPIFIRQKPDGSCRLILNLKNLNEDMPYIHFKMETLSFITHYSRVLFGSTGPESNKAKGRKSKRVFQENKARQIFRKTNISYPLIRTRTCTYQGVENVRFSENLACFVFLKHSL